MMAYKAAYAVQSIMAESQMTKQYKAGIGWENVVQT